MSQSVKDSDLAKRAVTLNLSGELVWRIDAITDREITPSEFARQAVEAIVAMNEARSRSRSRRSDFGSC